MDAYINALGNNEYYEQVLRVIALLDKPDLKALPLNGEKWYEIDDIQDLSNAETIFAEKENQLACYQKRYGGYWSFPSLKMKKEMRANFDILLSEYPSGLNVNSLLIAKYFGLAQQYVCPGNGAAELIKYLVDELTGCLGVVYPTFEEYPNRMQEDKVIAYVPQNKDFSYTADDLMAFFAVREVAAILLINPDNPSGNYISKVDVVHLAKWCKDGVPGLRLGILASSNLLLIDRVRKNVPIWNINSFAEFYMQIFNKYEQDYKQACRLFIRERDRFYVDLQQIGYLRVIPSQANYFLCEVISKYSSKELTELLLNEYNILIKDCGTKKAFRNGEYIRIAVRSTLDNQRLIDALKEL